MTAFLIDDEPHCTDVLRVLLEQHCPEVVVTRIFNDAEAALAALQERAPELVFLDIEMPVLNGFDLLRRCPANSAFRLIFTTAYDQYAVKAFKFNALDYLLKPIDPTELIAAVGKSRRTALPSARQLDAVEHLRRQAVPERIGLPVGQELLLIGVGEIVYCESEGSYVSFYLDGAPRPLIVTKSLREIEDLLNNPEVFFRCHNSYLVNLRHIKKIVRSDGGGLVMRNGREVPVARAKKPELLRLVVRL